MRKPKFWRPASVATAFLVLGLVCLLTPMRTVTTTHGFPTWILGIFLLAGGVGLWVDALIGRARDRD
ncbi:hypothetical protein [Curtobacterium sp. BH-2-1-1]|uniref:hypothetical protein n=1 Tax=Curtobacterium sp. BH-2-1-1 TaxID=1905847 RepID=UPI0012EA9054|nr:hypothetical protein [Curtobacterium sp. BH-2-1-1]